jgi:hypothetical protein
MQSFFVNKKTVIIEAVILVLFLVGGYYVYSSLSEASGSTTQTQFNEQLLGQNFVMFLKVVNQDKISFRDISFMNTPLVQQLRDFSETINPTETRGRLDPFVPYASSRSIR